MKISKETMQLVSTYVKTVIPAPVSKGNPLAIFKKMVPDPAVLKKEEN